MHGATWSFYNWSQPDAFNGSIVSAPGSFSVTSIADNGFQLSRCLLLKVKLQKQKKTFLWGGKGSLMAFIQVYVSALSYAGTYLHNLRDVMK